VTLEELYEKVRKLPPMTERQREEQGFSFSYGNLACTTNHKPTRAAFAKLARDRGWTEEQFAAWADTREWWSA
jgi:hypothetical protein